MRILVTLVSSSTLLAHVLLGCCWHHPHSAHREQPTGTEPQAHVVAATCGHQHDGHSHHGEAPRPTRSGDCEQADCVFLAEAKSKCPVDALAMPYDIPSAARSDVMGSTRGAAWRAGRELFGDPGPPVRRHLLHQVLLV